jgi:hypothetical protein
MENNIPLNQQAGIDEDLVPTTVSPVFYNVSPVSLSFVYTHGMPVVESCLFVPRKVHTPSAMLQISQGRLSIRHFLLLSGCHVESGQVCSRGLSSHPKNRVKEGIDQIFAIT